MKYLYLDTPEPWQTGFQDEATPVAAGIIDFHNKALYYLIFIFIFVTYLIIIIIINKRGISWFRNITHQPIIEIIWTVLPGVILVILAGASLRLMYSIDEIIKPQVTVKITGGQWYWTYEINDIEGVDIKFDSYVKLEEDLKKGEYRLLEVDNRLVLPINTPIRILLTSKDVIHSAFIPSFGLKMDAIPGRINMASLIILRPGIYYGQCTELCGQLHAQMPLVIEAVETPTYLEWLLTFVEEKKLIINPVITTEIDNINPIKTGNMENIEKLVDYENIKDIELLVPETTEIEVNNIDDFLEKYQSIIYPIAIISVILDIWALNVIITELIEYLKED